MDLAFIGPGAHKLCAKGEAQVFLMQHMGDGDCILGLNGIKTIEELKGKKVGYSAGTSSESILTTALASVGLTMDDIEAVSMDATALTTAALSGQVDAVAAWSPMSLTILDKGTDVTDICSNADFATMASPGSWVVNPDWAAANADVLVRFNRAMFKAMDFASAATTDDAVAQEVAGYVAAITGLDVESTVAQRYDGSWLNSTQVLEMIESGKLVEYYNNQQVNFGDAAGPLKADEFVLVDLMINAK
jgi:NitT/TauT family transport system substrate-binding protein